MIELLRGDRPFVRVGHRRNTAASIEAAIAAGVDVVEIDVLESAGRIVLAHERGEADAAGPLDEALALLAHAAVGIQVDLKAEGYERAVVEALRRFDLLERSFVSSFSFPSLRALAAAEPELRRAFTYPEDRLGLSRRVALDPFVRAGLAAARRTVSLRVGRWLDRAGASAATLHWSIVTPAAVARCHARGAAVYAWTVNDVGVAKNLLSAGIDGIISDDPGIFQGLPIHT